MTNQSQDGNSYDEVPYRSSAYPQSHPDRLATIARLFGMHPRAVDNARVLELGCASGGNLIPMAEMYADSHFIGIDRSAQQVAAGAAIVDELRLNNIELLHRDIRDVNQELGEFHYIIAHGVFSWVPDDVQSKIFEICQQNLLPNGVAYISYNTFPGWRMRSMIRDMVVYHARKFTEPEQQVEQARALLSFLVDATPGEGDAYGAYLRQELQLFGQVEDSYLYHEHLEHVNEPTYFHEFIQRAEQHRLQYLGEAHFSVMASANFPSHIDSTLQRISRDIIDIEQYMDFLRHRTFRQTLLCHADQELDRSLDPRYVKELYFASRLTPASSQVDARSADPVRFTTNHVKVETVDPLIKAALLRLGAAWPGWMGFEELLREARGHSQPLVEPESVDQDALKLGEHLIRCYASHAVEFHATPPRFLNTVTPRPFASPLARLQARSGSYVTTRKHETARLDELRRRILSCLDGRHAHQDVLNHLYELVQRRELIVQEDGQPVVNPARLAGLLEEALPGIFRQFADGALLVR